MQREDSTSGGNLPAELTSFVGRREELGAVKQLLGAFRLVTLTGVGGTGKTRLAARAAAEHQRAFPDGVWFVDLTALRAPVPEVHDRDELAYLVMGVLGLREQDGAGSPTDQLVGHLAGWQALLVLDNCEHLLPVSAVLTDQLLRGCPRLKILATSREPLLLEGETLFAVPPLPVPGRGADLAQAQQCESVALFVARARAVVPAFAHTEDTAGVMVELCRRLDGLPLALELAAARVRVLTLHQILERLAERFDLLSRGSRTVPERQRTLRGSVEWSFDLCTNRERLLWARASVFVDGFDLEAAEGICADEELPVEDLLEVVAGLVDKSILLRDDQGAPTARYRMLATLRDYGQDKLREWGKSLDFRRWHRVWYSELACRFEADWLSARQPEWFARLDRELLNIRAALRDSLTDPDGAEATLALARRMYLFWGVRGMHSEAYAWLERALARPAGPTMERVKAYLTATQLAGMQGDVAGADRRAWHAQEIARQLDDSRARAIAAAAEAFAAMARGELAEAVWGFQRSVDGLAAEQAEEYLFWKAGGWACLAMTQAMLDDVTSAAAGYEAVLKICHSRGEYWYCGTSLWILGLMLWRQGQLEAAAARLREGLTRLRRVNDTMGTSWCLDTLAWIAFDEGRRERAATLLGAVERLARFMGARAGLFPDLVAHHERYGQRTQAALGERAYRAAFTRGEQMPLDEVIAFAHDEPQQPAAADPIGGPSTPLTRREQQVAVLIAQGLSNKQIAAKLMIAQRTAESHVDHILAKLALTNRAQAAAWTATHLAMPAGE